MDAPIGRLAFCLCLACLFTLAPLAADEVDDLFTEPSQEVEQKPSVLAQYQAQQKKLSFSWNLTTVGGMYAGWHSLGDLADPASTFDHTSVGSISLTSYIDLRPFDYLQVHEESSFTYPSSSFSFSLNWLNSLYFDYSLPSGPSFRMGKYGVGWGNARILGVADLPGRSVSLSTLDPTVEILPSWLHSTTPSLWLKAAFPLASYQATGIMSLPSEAGQGISQLSYGLLNEYVIKKTYIGLAGFYQEAKTSRCALMLKTSAWNIDFYLDSSLAFRAGDSPLPSVMGGLYYQPSSGPEIKALYELRWNGERTISSGLVGDALAQGGFSQAMGLSWSSVGGSSLSLGATWYHYWEDGSGALVAMLSYPLGSSLSVKAVIPLIYGDAGSWYITTPPAEALGYAAGAALMLVLKADF